MTTEEVMAIAQHEDKVLGYEAFVCYMDTDRLLRINVYYVNKTVKFHVTLRVGKIPHIASTIFGIMVVKPEALKWLVNGFLSQAKEHRWDYEKEDNRDTGMYDGNYEDWKDLL